MTDDVVIKVDNVKKSFKLPHQKSDMLKHDIIHAFKRKKKTIETFHALKGVSFDIKKGEFFGIVGRNGSGKSTMLKILSKIYTPTSGTVSHKGKLVPFIELGVGFKPELTGRENVYLNGALLGFSTKEIDERYDKIVEFAELEQFMDQKLKNYSSGMKVRLAFSVAIRANADILVLDEVLAVGDAAFQQKCNEYFQNLKLNNKTVVLVSHSMSAIRQNCDRAVLIDEGVVAHEGTAESVAEKYLELFNPVRHQEEQLLKLKAERDKANRWGVGGAVIESVDVEVTDDKICVEVCVRGEKTLQNLVIGLNIIKDKKTLVSGVERDIQEKNTFSLKKGDKRKLRYEFSNILGRGMFSLSVSIKMADNSIIYDFWRHAAVFENTKDASDYFPVVVPVDVIKD